MYLFQYVHRRYIVEVRKRMVELLKSNETIIVPGVYDALLGRIVEQVGFQAVYMTGAGVSYSTLGKPDLGLVTLSEMVTRAKQICDAVDIPVIADADNGFGNALNVMRTVNEYEKAGVSIIQIEDQIFPKKCGHMEDKELVSSEEMVQKIKAALDARQDPNFLIMARTDARGVYGLEEAIKRAQQYEEAGADVIFVESPQSVEELKEIRANLSTYLLANMVEGGKTPILERDELQKLGYSIVIYPGAISRYMIPNVTKMLTNLKDKGTTKDYHQQMFMFNEMNKMLDLPHYEQLQKKYKHEKPII
jgi:methylisocitrate lyase